MKTMSPRIKMENCRVHREVMGFFYEYMYYNGGGYSHNIGYIAPPNETVTLAVADNHDSHNSYYTYAHQKNPNWMKIHMMLDMNMMDR